MNENVANNDISFADYALTQHALQRMGARGFSSADVNLVLAYGRKVHTRGASIYVIGRKEIAECSHYGVDLSSLDGVQVVCSPEGAIMTVYRNRDFRSLRPRRRRIH